MRNTIDFRKQNFFIFFLIWKSARGFWPKKRAYWLSQSSLYASGVIKELYSSGDETFNFIIQEP